MSASKTKLTINFPTIIFKRFIRYLFITVCFFVLFYSLYRLISWKVDSDLTNEKITNSQSVIISDNIEDSEKTVIIETTPAENDPYWSFLEMDLLDIDFSELKKQNDQTVGWIQLDDTNINYQYVQTDNNDFYLTHSFDKSFNTAGWVFLDYRNQVNLSDKNNIIYAHGRLDGTMFGSLINTLSEEWFNNINNRVVKISTETEDSLWQIFSVYQIKETSDYLKINFESNNEFLHFVEMLKERSIFDFNTKISLNDRIITLSTCVGITDRAVLHAKLIKTSPKV